MKAHDFIQPRDRFITSKGLWFGGILSVVKILKCIGIYVINDLLKQIHVVPLLFIIKLIYSVILVSLHKPFKKGKRLSKTDWHGIIQYSIFISLAQILWFYGITLCGPVRAVLIYEHSALVVSACLSATFIQSASPTKTRGSVLLALGFLSLIILDRDATTPYSHNDNHGHHFGLNHLFYHAINWFGVADHKGGVFILLIALLVKVFAENFSRRLSNDVGGYKRLYALSGVVSSALLVPWTCFALMASANFIQTWLLFIVSALFVSSAVFVADFYAESAALRRLDSQSLNRYCSILIFCAAIVFSYVWFEPYRSANAIDLLHGHGLDTVEHGFSGGLIFTVLFFVLATIALTSADDGNKARAGQFVGYSAGGLPLYVCGEDFLHKTSQSVLQFAKTTLKQVVTNQDSRRIFYFLCLNLVFTFVEFIYGIFTNSLGLISDAFHMFFDCSALVIGLVAAVMSTWSRNRQFPYGYGRIELLSGFTNGLFLIVIACFIFSEAVKRMLEPPEVHTEKLLFVSIAGLLVNLFGIAVFHGGHGHNHGGGSSHGHSHGGSSSAITIQHHIDHHHHHHHHHGHSHDSRHNNNNDDHGHSHGTLGGYHDEHGHSHASQPSNSHHGHSHNANMQGVFLHILADTFGSVGVIISSLLIHYFGWYIADPICSLILSILIFFSVLPLLKQSTCALLLRPAHETQSALKIALDRILRLEGVVTYSSPRLWQVKSGLHAGTLHVQLTGDCDQQAISSQILEILKSAGVVQPVIQIEKELFHRTIHAICPSYETTQFYNHQNSMTDNNNNNLNGTSRLNILTISDHSAVYGRKSFPDGKSFVKSL